MISYSKLLHEVYEQTLLDDFVNPVVFWHPNFGWISTDTFIRRIKRAVLRFVESAKGNDTSWISS